MLLLSVNQYFTVIITSLATITVSLIYCIVNLKLKNGAYLRGNDIVSDIEPQSTVYRLYTVVVLIHKRPAVISDI